MKKNIIYAFFLLILLLEKRPQFILTFHIKISNVEKSSICRVNYELVKDKISTLGVLDYWCNLKKIFHFLFFLRYFWKKKYSVKLYILEKIATINIMKQQILLILSSSKLFTRLMHNGAKNWKNSAIINCSISERGNKIAPFETIVLLQQSFIGILFHFLPHGASIN